MHYMILAGGLRTAKDGELPGRFVEMQPQEVALVQRRTRAATSSVTV